MAVQPDRDPEAPEADVETQPLPGEIERERADISVVSILAVLALVVVAGLWFFTKDKEMVASDGTTVKQTTGSRAQELPLPNTPQLPTREPTPQQQ